MTMKIISVAGPTASGKSDLAIMLAESLGGEIISFDSMQIYRGMDIGTAKPSAEELARVPHHMIDVADPRENYSVASFVAQAKKVIDDVMQSGKTPILCGGTGLYQDSLIYGTEFGELESDEAYRNELANFASKFGNAALHAILAEKDPEAAEKIHMNNVKRVIRALEIIKATGRKKSDVDKENATLSDEYDATVIYPFYSNREILYSRIEKRVDAMMCEGLLDETLSLYNSGVFECSPTASAAIGYKELLPYIRGERELGACIDDLKCATRRYAKRQMTWFNQKEYAQKVYMDDENGIKTFEEIVNICEKLFH